VDVVTTVDPAVPAVAVAAAVTVAAAQSGQLHRLAWALQDRLELLTGAGAQAPVPSVRRLIDKLCDAGASGIAWAPCPHCAEELLAERGVTVDHVTIYRWVQRFTVEFIEAARPCRHVPGDRWFADETYVKVAGRWTYLYRAIDQHGQVIDALLSERRDLAAARRFFARALRAGTIPAEVTTDRAPAYPRVLDELIPSALHTVERYANNPVEADHGRLKARLRPMRGLKRHRSARTLAAGHAFVQNLRRGHYELATDVPARHRIRTAFAQLTMAM
jgi:transposase-like protein